MRISNWAAGLVVGLALLAPARQLAAQGFVLVANAAGPSSMSKDEVSRIFLKKSGDLTAVDQDKDSPVRGAFSKTVLGRPVSAVTSYWQQQIFSGNSAPPSEKGSDAEVLAFVRNNPRAIGYVRAGTDLGSGVQAVAVQ
jgi:ABC-type phosphate transport system substrate-binding protein